MQDTRYRTCPMCGRPKPEAEYKFQTDGTSILACAVIGFVAMCLVVGFGANLWLGTAVFFIVTICVGLRLLAIDRREFHRKRWGA